MNGEQRSPDTAAALLADMENLLEQVLNAELKSRGQSLQTASYNHVICSVSPVGHLVHQCSPDSYHALGFFCSCCAGHISVFPNPPSSLTAHARDKGQFTSISSIRNKCVARESLIISSYFQNTLFYATIKNLLQYELQKCVNLRTLTQHNYEVRQISYCYYRINSLSLHGNVSSASRVCFHGTERLRF